MRLLLVALTGAVLLSGCYRYHSYLPGVARQADAREYEVLSPFTVEVERRWWLFGFGKVHHDELDLKIRAAVSDAGGDGASGVRIVTEQDAGDTAFTLLNLILPCGWYARHMVVTGNVVRFRKGETDEEE